jgi:hypothetical protein
VTVTVTAAPMDEDDDFLVENVAKM